MKKNSDVTAWVFTSIGVRGVKEYWPGGKMLAYEVKNLILVVLTLELLNYIGFNRSPSIVT